MRGDDVRPAADVYSLGAILFELFAGKPLHPVGQHAIASTLATLTVAPSSAGGRCRPNSLLGPMLTAQCAAHRQAWHLQQMIPRRAQPSRLHSPE